MTAYTILQPTTFEEVLASVCYSPYWVHTALLRKGVSVRLYEDMTFRGMDEYLEVASSDCVLIDVSSAPQVELALAVWRKWGHVRNIRFIGYKPYVETYIPRGRFFDVAEEGTTIEDGVFNYVYNISQYSHAHATLDSHVVCPGDDRNFMPAFLSVGCNRHCEYCYISKTNYPYGVLDYESCVRLIDFVADHGWNLHVEDENFYRHPHAHRIIEYLQTKQSGRGLKWIAIGDSLSLGAYVREHSVNSLVDAGHHLTEIGLETVDPQVLSKRQDIATLVSAQQQGLSLFWLSVVLFPEETVRSLNLAGQFYTHHGTSWDRLVPRLRTQSSVGGCGQFYQPYPGTRFWPRAETDGVFLREPLMRLRPSWVGHKLLRDVPVATTTSLRANDIRWIELYSTCSVAEYLLQRAASGCLSVDQLTQRNPEHIAVFASLAKLGYLVSAKENHE